MCASETNGNFYDDYPFIPSSVWLALVPMGRGIAQIAAQGGCQVLLFDAQSGAADTARAAVQEQWQRLLSKGRISEEQLQAWSARLQPVARHGRPERLHLGGGSHR